MEAWTIAWSDRNENQLPRYRFYSGGDDCVLWRGKTHDSGSVDESVLRVSLREQSRDIKAHLAGVTAILPTKILEAKGYQVIITGSYDEHVRVLLLPDNSKKSKVLHEMRVHGGGVWRLKEISSEQDSDGTATIIVLASCMHAGARVLNISRSSNGVWSVEITAAFLEHGSMNYASDIRKSLPEEERGWTVVSTSFYDRKLCVWNLAGT